MDDGRLTIGEVERRSGVKATTLRWYEDVGVLPAPERVSGQRRYPPAVLRRLEMVDAAQRAGCTLAEIADLFAAGEDEAGERLRALAGAAPARGRGARRARPRDGALARRGERVRLRDARGLRALRPRVIPR